MFPPVAMAGGFFMAKLFAAGGRLAPRSGLVAAPACALDILLQAATKTNAGD